MVNNLVFFHFGKDPSVPRMMAQSVKFYNPSIHVIQCSPQGTDRADPSVNEHVRVDVDESLPMVARLEAFSKLRLDTPAIYLDTDMICSRSLPSLSDLDQYPILFCRRSYQVNGSFIGIQRGLNFMEYHGKPLGQVYPIVASATITKNYEPWSEMLQILLLKPKKFHHWYGDQEAMRIYAKRHREAISFIDENIWARLPEFKDKTTPYFYHFKGNRKHLMEDFYNSFIEKNL